MPDTFVGQDDILFLREPGINKRKAFIKPVKAYAMIFIYVSVQKEAISFPGVKATGSVKAFKTIIRHTPVYIPIIKKLFSVFHKKKL